MTLHLLGKPTRKGLQGFRGTKDNITTSSFEVISSMKHFKASSERKKHLNAGVAALIPYSKYGRDSI